MHHILAYEEVVATAANTDLDAIVDDIVRINNSHFVLPRDMQLVYVAAAEADITAARVVTPTLRQVAIPQIDPLIAAAIPATDPNVADYRDNPLRLTGSEEIAVELTSGTGGQSVAVIGITEGLRPAPRGDILTLRGVSTTAAVALTWTTLAITFDSALPRGQYALVGMRVLGATQVAARAILEGQIWRPGTIGQPVAGARTDKMFYRGGLGNWGEFDNESLPQVQVLNTATANAFTILMDLVRVR